MINEFEFDVVELLKIVDFPFERLGILAPIFAFFKTGEEGSEVEVGSGKLLLDVRVSALGSASTASRLSGGIELLRFPVGVPVDPSIEEFGPWV